MSFGHAESCLSVATVVAAAAVSVAAAVVASDVAIAAVRHGIDIGQGVVGLEDLDPIDSHLDSTGLVVEAATMSDIDDTPERPYERATEPPYRDRRKKRRQSRPRLLVVDGAEKKTRQRRSVDDDDDGHQGRR